MGMLFVGVPRGADHERFAMRGRQLAQPRRRGMMREFDQHLGAVNRSENIIALVDAGDQLQPRLLFREAGERLTHAAARADNDDPD